MSILSIQFTLHYNPCARSIFQSNSGLFFIGISISALEPVVQENEKTRVQPAQHGKHKVLCTPARHPACDAVRLDILHVASSLLLGQKLRMTPAGHLSPISMTLQLPSVEQGHSSTHCRGLRSPFSLQDALARPRDCSKPASSRAEKLECTTTIEKVTGAQWPAPPRSE